MSFRLIIAGTDVTNAVIAAPTIGDALNANCCTLDFDVQQEKNPQNLLGKDVELFINDVCWYHGKLRKQDPDAKGGIKYTAYDPLFTVNKFTDDFYFKNQTATQIFTAVAERTRIPLGNIANTEAVFPQLYYPSALAEKVLVDCLARTKNASGRKYWYRYDPVSRGVILFERNVPADIWVFKAGLNLTSASRSDSITDTYTTVKLINRETGQVVIKSDDALADEYSLHTQLFEEVNDSETDINTLAAERLAKNAKLDTSMSIEGINPNGVIPRLYKGDAIYVEEPNTGLVGGYYIRNITTTVDSHTLITLKMDIVLAPDLPEIQFTDAATLTTETGEKAESKKESETTVYIQPDGKLYHKPGCIVIEGCSCTKTTKEKAKKKGALQCAVCKA